MPHEPDRIDARLTTTGTAPVTTVRIPVTKPLPEVLVWQGRYVVRCSYYDPHVPLGYRQVGALVLQDNAGAPGEHPPQQPADRRRQPDRAGGRISGDVGSPEPLLEVPAGEVGDEPASEDLLQVADLTLASSNATSQALAGDCARLSR